MSDTEVTCTLASSTDSGIQFGTKMSESSDSSDISNKSSDSEKLISHDETKEKDIEDKKTDDNYSSIKLNIEKESDDLLQKAETIQTELMSEDSVKNSSKGKGFHCITNKVL